MESPSPLSGWVTPEQAILTLEPPFPHLSNGAGGACKRSPRPVVGGEHCLHVRCLVLPVTSSPPPRPSLALPSTVSPFGRGGGSE